MAKGAFHTGRSDTVRAALPDGAFVIPADVVSALGEGSSEAGYAALESMFGRPDQVKPAKAVQANVSVGEYVVPPEAVAKVGPKTLESLILKTRDAARKRQGAFDGPKMPEVE